MFRIFFANKLIHILEEQYLPSSFQSLSSSFKCDPLNTHNKGQGMKKGGQQPS